jgi:DNA polymerase III psi subunit
VFLDQKIYTIGLLKDKNDIPGVQNYTNGWLVILPTYVDLEKKDAILKFLKSIFTALNVDIENTLVLEEDFVKHNHLGTLNKYIPLKNILVFGVNTSNIGLKFDLTKYQFYSLSSYSILLADGLDAIEGNVLFKKALWQAIKEKV